MSEVGDDWRTYKESRQSKRASNREYSAGYLQELGIKFQAKNAGAHLIVQGKKGKIDFWPGTGLFIPRSTRRRGHGVRNLVKLCEVHCETRQQ